MNGVTEKLDAVRSGRLPGYLTAFVGRQAELAELTALLAGRRLVTIAGSGGCGKTRLAREALAASSESWRDGVRWAALETIVEPGRVVPVVAAAVGAFVDPSHGPLAGLLGHLGDRELCVCLDNCEHVLDACTELVGELLGECPGLTVLATSRVPLGVAGETVWRVPSMVEHDAVGLFVERARTVRPGYVDAEQTEQAVCRRLDGIPLAIELAAAWARVLTPAEILAALDDRFRLLVGASRATVARQQTLAASVEWSYDLLDEDTRVLLGRLAVFSGGCTLADVAAVCAGDPVAAGDVLGVLARLVDASMVQVDQAGDMARYRLLETMREYAAARLDAAGDASVFRDRHLAHFLAVAEAAAGELEHGDQDVVLTRLEEEHDNLRAALAWGLSRPDPSPGRRLARALAPLWLVHGHAHEGIRLLQAAVDAAPDDRSSVQAELYAALALLSAPAGRLTLSGEASARAVDLAEADGGDRVLARAYASALYLPFYMDYGQCEALSRRARHHAEASGDTFAANWSLLMEACSYMTRDRFDDMVRAAQAVFDRAAPHNDRWNASFALSLLQHAALLTGDLRRAPEIGAEAIRIAEPLDDYFVVGTNTINLAWVRGVTGQVAEGWRLIEPVVRSVQSAGRDVDVVGMGLAAGRLRLWQGDLEGAVDWLSRAARFAAPRVDNWISVRALPDLSDVLRRLGRPDEAGEAAERGVAAARALGTPHAEADALDALGRLVVASDPGRAEALHHQALALRVDHGVRTFVVDSLDALAGLAAGEECWAEAGRLLAASDRARDRMGYPRRAIDRPHHDGVVAAVRAGLGDVAFAAAGTEGSRMTLDSAVAYASRGRGARQRPVSGWASLTRAERQVAALVAEGLSNPQVAARLFVSRATVKTHLQHIYGKLGITNRTELAVLTWSAQDPSP